MVTMASDAKSPTETIGFELIGPDLGRDVESALSSALMEGAVFPEGADPLGSFRKTLAASIADIETTQEAGCFKNSC